MEACFAGLGAQELVVFSKAHDIMVEVEGEHRTLPILQEGRATYRGNGRAQFSIRSEESSPVSYAVLLQGGLGSRTLQTDLTEAQLAEAAAAATQDGRRCIGVSMVARPAGAVYSAIWEQAPEGVQSILYPRMTESQVTQALDAARGAEMMPLAIASCFEGKERLYAVAFSSSGGAAWEAVVGASDAAFSAQVQSRLQSGDVPTAIASHEEHGQFMCSGVFVKLEGISGASANLSVSAESLQDSVSRYRGQGLTPLTLAATAGYPPRFHLSAAKLAQSPTWQVLEGLTGPELAPTLAQAAAQGLQPAAVAAY